MAPLCHAAGAGAAAGRAHWRRAPVAAAHGRAAHELFGGRRRGHVRYAHRSHDAGGRRQLSHRWASGLNITGLNTAATLWCSAAIGTLAGYGLYGSATTGALAVLAANICLRPVGRVLNRGKGNADLEITYLFRITARTDQEAHMRALLLNSIGGQPLLLRSLKSDDVEHTEKVEIQATLVSSGRQNSILEQIVSRLSLEPSVSGVSWRFSWKMNNPGQAATRAIAARRSREYFLRCP